MSVRDLKLLILPLAILAGASFLLCRYSDKKQSAATAQTPPPIPGFPAPPAYLESINASPANDAMRKHAWDLLSSLAPQGSGPLWRQKPWQSKCELHLSPRCNDADPNAAKNPIFPGTSPQTPLLQNGTRPVFSTVYYNTAAADFILTNKLNTGEGLQSIIATGRIDPVSHVVKVPNIPPESIIVKEIWEGFNASADGGTSDFHAPVAHVYIPGDVPVVDGQLASVDNFPPIPILLDKTGKIDIKAECDDKAVYDETHAVPINCFYNVHPSGNCTMNPKAPPTVTPVPLTNYPCYGILVGFQIATGEIGNLTWSTFWWSNNPLSDPTHQSGQPTNLDKRFTHFLMDTTFGPVGNATDDPRIIFNPYLEGPNPHGAQSNCFHCHNSAAYVPRCTIGQQDPTCANQNSAEKVLGVPQQIKPCPVAAKGLQRVNAHCALITSHLWSLATNQDSDTPFPAVFDVRLPHANKEKTAQR